MKRQSNRRITLTQGGQRRQQGSQFLRVRHSRVVQSLHTVFLQGGLNAARAGRPGRCTTESKAYARCRHFQESGGASIRHAKSRTAKKGARERKTRYFGSASVSCTCQAGD